MAKFKKPMLHEQGNKCCEICAAIKLLKKVGGG